MSRFALGAVQRKFPRRKHLRAAKKAKAAANKAGLIVKDRLAGTGKYSAVAKEMRKAQLKKKHESIQSEYFVLLFVHLSNSLSESLHS